MSNAFDQSSSSPPAVLDGLCVDNNHLNDSIDLCNEDTFGSGAIEDDWELEHNQFVDIEDAKEYNKFKSDRKEKQGHDLPHNNSDTNRDVESFIFDPSLSICQLNEEELELSNQQLAAAVEELVLNSDQDQDAIDPAIVSLRKQAPLVMEQFSASPKLAPYYESSHGKQFGNMNMSSLFDPAPPFVFDSGKMQSIWNKSKQETYEQSQSQSTTTVGRTEIIDSFPPPLQDNAILTAIRDNPVPASSRNRLDISNPLVMKVEDLERELQDSSSSSDSSPVYGISIPKSCNASSDRSLPARSVSPVFGSPTPSAMPIGTPPKHIIMDMMHQLEQLKNPPEHKVLQTPGSSGGIVRPPLMHLSGIPQPRLPPMINHPPPPLNIAHLPMHPVPPNVMWPRHRMPVNSLMTQDVVNRLGIRMRSAPPLQGPIVSSPAFTPITSSRMIPSGSLHPMLRQPPPRFAFIDQGHKLPHGPPRVGPGHLHPEHSKFVRMRQERSNDRHSHRSNHRGYSRDGRVGMIGDPYTNIMTQREKDWVVRIQMMALQSDRPEIDDYYYQNYIERRLRDGKLSEPDKPTQRLITPTKPNFENRKYVPVQFVNSLGKLTASSVYNPRQIIDVNTAATHEEEEKTVESDTSRQALSKRLVVYKKIEKAYDLVVEIEEAECAMSMLDTANSLERNSLRDNFEKKVKLVEEVIGFHDDLQGDIHKDPVFQIMKIRKGKKLMSRIMRFLSLDHSIAVLDSVISHLPILIKRDAKDKVMLELYEPISHTISELNQEQFVRILQKATTFTLAAAVRDQVGVSIICKLLDRGRFIYDAGEDNDFDTLLWQKFVVDVSDVIVAVANPKEGSRHARPSTPSPLLEEFPMSVFEILTNHQTDQELIVKLKASFDRLVSNKPPLSNQS